MRDVRVVERVADVAVQRIAHLAGVVTEIAVGVGALHRAQRLGHGRTQVADEVRALLQVLTDQRQLSAEARRRQRRLDQVEVRVDAVEVREVHDDRGEQGRDVARVGHLEPGVAVDRRTGQVEQVAHGSGLGQPDADRVRMPVRHGIDHREVVSVVERVVQRQLGAQRHRRRGLVVQAAGDRSTARVHGRRDVAEEVGEAFRVAGRAHLGEVDRVIGLGGRVVTAVRVAERESERAERGRHSGRDRGVRVDTHLGVVEDLQVREVRDEILDQRHHDAELDLAADAQRHRAVSLCTGNLGIAELERERRRRVVVALPVQVHDQCGIAAELAVLERQRGRVLEPVVEHLDQRLQVVLRAVLENADDVVQLGAHDVRRASRGLRVPVLRHHELVARGHGRDDADLGADDDRAPDQLVGEGGIARPAGVDEEIRAEADRRAGT